MTTNEDLADLTLHHLGRSGCQPFVVVIGAMDGVSFDDFHGYIAMYRWSGLFVEPIPEQFRRLRANYAALPHRPDNLYENCAIADHDGTVQMVTIDQEAIDNGEVHPAFGGMSAIDPPRNGLASAADGPIVARYGRRIEVPCLTLPSLLARHRVEHLDLLCIDAEGWDYRILRQLDFSTHRPKLIRCEFINLSRAEQFAAVRLLEHNRYVVRLHEANLDAVPEETWVEVQAEARAMPSPQKRVRPGTVTLVTGVFDLSAAERDMRLRRGFARYLDEVKRLLAIDWPMVIFAQPELAELIQRHRRGDHTAVIVKSLADLEAFPFFRRIQQIRAQAGAPDDNHPTLKGLEWRLRLYNPFALSKQFFLNDASVIDPFDSEAFFWVDGDIGNGLGDPLQHFDAAVARRLTELARGDRMLYLCRPWAERVEAPAFHRSQMAELTVEEPTHLVCGRFFGGTRLAIEQINSAYYSHLMWSLERGYMGTEEQVMTMLSYTHRDFCELQHLAPGESVRGFFARLVGEAP